jgi:hypothetical protein
MLFMVMSRPQPGRPTELRGRQAAFWDWLKPLEASGTVKACYVPAGRGAIVVFDVDSHETLHRLVNEWSDCVPARHTIIPLVDRAFQERRARGG